MEEFGKRTVMVLIPFRQKAKQRNMEKRISINQFAEYSSKKRESSKLSIIRNQKKPDRNLFFWYQRAKACIRRSLKLNGSLIPIYEGLEFLKKDIPLTKNQISNRDTSILALERFTSMKLPRVILENSLDVLKLEKKTLKIRELEISPSPEFVFRLRKANGESVIGAVKLHICKSKPFDFQTAELSSVVLYDFLKEAVGSNDVVDPRCCFTIDIFGDRIVPAPLNINEYNRKVEKLCEEIVQLWDAA